MLGKDQQHENWTQENSNECSLTLEHWHAWIDL